MNRRLLIVLFLLAAKAAFAQSDKDSLVYSLPVINGRLTYMDTIKLSGHTKAQLDTAAKKWFIGYFKYYRPDTLSKDKDPRSIILSQTVLEFRIATTSLALVKYKFYLLMCLDISCTDHGYSYKITNIFFVPESSFFRAAGYYQVSPDYLIGLYKKKHIGMANSLNMGRKKIREYLKLTDDTIQTCIASLKKAMEK